VVRLLFAAGLLLIFAPQSSPGEELATKLGYVCRHQAKEALSLLAIPAANDGSAGAELALADNNTTGKFLDQRFSLDEVRLKPNEDPVAAVNGLAERGASLILSDLPADDLIKAADAGRERGLLFFNVGATDDRLREQDCRPNVVHSAPTRSMLADALGQYLVWKQWRRWLLITGSHDADKLFADALRRTATKFAAKIVQERTFEDRGGGRRTDSGIVQVQRQMPVLTQSAPSYDVLLAADESEVFAGYLPYRTWDPRPVAGSAGLVPTSWDPAFDQWGAIQLQNRFVKLFSRRMTALDMQAWTAARMIGEAVSRTQSNEPKVLLAFMQSPNFELAAFKGQKLTLRDWNLQLRQPILLADGRMVVSVSPQEGYLHQVTELDTLGYDRPESKCHFK
jgi:ABC transporter substrate binding protein (PQQ-dependent alcohol dehydrogenase system)